MKYIVIKNVDIDELALSVRTWNCLRRAQLDTIQNIVDRFDELKYVRNLGQRCYEEITEKIKPYVRQICTSGGINSELRKDCPMRDKIGNCVSGGFCTANSNELCEALHNAYDAGKMQALSEVAKWKKASKDNPIQF